MKSPDPPRPARAAPASTPVAAGAAPGPSLAGRERVPPLPTESGAASRTSAARSDGRTGPAVQPVDGPRGAESENKEDRGGREEGAKEKHEQKPGAKEKHEQKPGEEGKESDPQPQAEVPHTALSAERGTPPSPLSLLSPRGSRRRAEADEADEARRPGTPAVTTGLEAEEASPGTGRDPDILTGVTPVQDAAGTDSAGAGAAVGRRGARAFLRGSHRTVLTVAAVTGVVLVAGVLVGLRSGGAAHDTATPDAAASVLDPDSGSGSRAGVPGALPLPSGHTTGPTPDGTPAGHVGKGDPAGGKDTGSGSGKADSHGAASGSHGDGKGDSTSSSTAGDQPAAHRSQTPGSTHHSTAPAAPAGSSAPSVSGVEVYSHDSNRCITVVGGQGKDGSPLEIRDCTGSAAQKWTIRSDGTIRAFGLCMDLAGASTANGTVIQLAYCNGGPAQQFDLNFRHDLVNVPADKCVDVTDAQTANGTRLQLWNCNGFDNQKWSKR